MHPQLNIALRAARDAGSLLARGFDRLDRIQVISNDRNGLLTSMDQEADEEIVSQLRKTFPEHSIQSRVSGLHEGAEGEALWLVDPVVGNHNYMSGYPVFAVAIACKTKGVTSQALMLNPMNQDEYLASRGKGAQLNGHRIRVTTQSGFETALLGLSALDLDVELYSNFQSLLLRANAGIRSHGCSPLDIAFTAAGQLQGGWCTGLAEVSLAASRLILTESGGYISNASGSPATEGASELIFGSPKMFRELVKLRGRLS